MRYEDKVIDEVKTGDTVYLRGGGPPMSVVRVFTTATGKRMAETEYFDGERNHTAIHPCDALVVREPFLEEE